MIKRKLKKCAGCGEDKILFSKGMCQYCWSVGYKKPINKSSAKNEARKLLYTPVRNKFLCENPKCLAKLEGCTKEPKKPKPIPKISKKREKESREYTIKRLKFLAQPENMKCPITGERATEIHHTYSGANRSRFYLDETTWMAVSRKGHLWIHANPVEARELNYLKSY